MCICYLFMDAQRTKNYDLKTLHQNKMYNAADFDTSAKQQFYFAALPKQAHAWMENVCVPEREKCD